MNPGSHLASSSGRALELEGRLGASYPKARPLEHEIRHVMPLRKQSRQLTAREEIDGSYLGGEVDGAKVGRGSPDEAPFVTAVQTTAFAATSDPGRLRRLEGPVAGPDYFIRRSG